MASSNSQSNWNSMIYGGTIGNNSYTNDSWIGQTATTTATTGSYQPYYYPGVYGGLSHDGEVRLRRMLEVYLPAMIRINASEDTIASIEVGIDQSSRTLVCTAHWPGESPYTTRITLESLTATEGLLRAVGTILNDLRWQRAAYVPDVRELEPYRSLLVQRARERLAPSAPMESMW
jgi:hypothetical protein